MLGRWCPVPRMMTEKDLFLELLNDERSLNWVLEGLNESTKRGNILFKKTKVRKLLGKQLVSQSRGNLKSGSALGQLDQLLDQFDDRLYAGFSLGELLQRFSSGDCPEVAAAQFLILRRFFPDYFNRHFQDFAANVQGGRFWLAGLSAFQSLEEAEDFYLKGRDSWRRENADVMFGQALQVFLSEVGSLEKELDLMKGLDFLGYESLVRQHIYQGGIAIMGQFGAKPDESLQKAAGEMAILLAFLSVGVVNEELHQELVWELWDKHQSLNTSIANELTLVMERGFSEEVGRLEQRNQDLQEELLQTLTELKEAETHAKEAGIKHQSSQAGKEAAMDQIREEYERMKQELEGARQKQSELSGIREKLAMLQEEASAKRQHEEQAARLAEELARFHALSEGYSWGLSEDFGSKQVMVVHKMEVLYAPHVYPDVSFLSVEEALEKKELGHTVFVQQYGLSSRAKNQVAELARLGGSRVLPLNSREEREMIMDLAVFLKMEKEGGQDEHSI